MAGNLVIVAIPGEDDRVWKVSSEKVPHLTILHLGDADQVANLDQLMLFVEHATSTSLRRFYLPVERRGELGADQADVLFFRKNRYDAKAIRDFRALLLKDTNIKTAYDTSTQFETPEEVGEPGQPWIPHLTLGYPATPAKPLPDEYSTLYDVCFDKIAVWTGEYNGPEFQLKDYWDEEEEYGGLAVPMDVAMSDIRHHGVKGQRWGVRRDVPNGGHILIDEPTGKAKVSTASTVAIVVPVLVMPVLAPLAFLSPRVRSEFGAARKVNKGVNADKKWKKQFDKSKRAVDVHNTAADEINSKVTDFNNDKRWKDVDLNQSPTKKADYDRAVERELLNPAYARAAQKVYGSNSPTGRYKLEIHDEATALLKVTDTKGTKESNQVQHAATDDTMELRFKILRDETGHILGFTPEDEDVIEHDAADLGREFLEHHGVKGMHWGERKSDISRAAGSNPSKLGKAVAEADRFSRDVHFESQVHPRTSESGGKIDSAAKEHIVHEAHKDFHGKDLPKIKAKPEYQKAKKLRNRLLHPKDPATKAYRNEVKQAYIKRLEQTANSKKNASGTRQYTIREHGGDLPGSKYYWEVSTREVQHADAKPIMLEVLMDEDGFITDIQPTDSAVHTVDLGAEFLSHYGVKGMRWGVRREDATSGHGSPETGERKRTTGLQAFLDPQGHRLSDDVVKTAIGTLVPVVAPLTWPAQIRLVRGGARAANAKLIDREEKKFAEKAMSPKNFVDIHNGAGPHIDREINRINKKYPDDLTKKPAKQKAYDSEIQKAMQDGYKQSANSIGNKNRTHHLDVEFKNDGYDFVIKAVPGRPKPIPKPLPVKHAAADQVSEEDITIEIPGKIKRDATGHIVGLTIDGFDTPMAHTADLGAEFLAHHGVKGMKWGQRKSEYITRQHQKQLAGEAKRRETRPASEVRATPTIGSSKRKKARVDTAGGHDHPPTEDAIKVAVATRKLKKSGTAALTNQELRDVQDRLNLEQNVTRLAGGQKSAGQKFIDGLLGRGSKDERRGVESQAGQTAQDLARRHGPKVAARVVRKVTVGV